jgi:serine/threonine protein kinase
MHPSDHHHQIPGPTHSSKHGSTITQDLHPPQTTPTEQQPLLRQDSVLSITEHLRAKASTFTEKYGRCHEIVHYGSNSTTRLHAPKEDKKLLAIKVYRQSILHSASSSHSTSIHPEHPNILPILDILHNERSELCLVMPYCAGGDLGTFISRNGPLQPAEADCLITQVLRALAYLHKYDIAHRDIRLETVLLTAKGSVKLAGFGDGHVRRMWEDSVCSSRKEPQPPLASCPQSTGFTLPWPLNKWSRHNSPFSCAASTKSNKIAYGGVSIPYVPPERFDSRRHSDGNLNDDLDPRPADVWATAMVYMALVTGKLLWRSARPHYEDERYLEYLDSRGGKDGYPSIEALGHVCICFLFLGRIETN